MAQKYRLVKWAGDGPHEPNPEPKGDDQAQRREVIVVKSPRRSTALWGFAAFAVVIVVLAAIWLTNVSSMLTDIKNGVSHNSGALAGQSAQLSGIQAYMHVLGYQLNQIQQEMHTFFANIMQALQHK